MNEGEYTYISQDNVAESNMGRLPRPEVLSSKFPDLEFIFRDFLSSEKISNGIL